MNLNALLTYLRDRSWTPSVGVADWTRAKNKKPRAKPRAPRMIEAFELEDRLLLSASPMSPEMLAALTAGEGPASDAGQTSPQATQVGPGDFVFSSADNPAAPTSSAEADSGSSLSAPPDQALADVDSAAAADTQFSLMFDASTGRLTIQGDSGDNVVHESMSADGFFEITINGVTRSSDEQSSIYDASLTGMARDTLREIMISSGGGNDQFVMADQSLGGGLLVNSDGDVIVAGNVRVEDMLRVNASLVSVEGSITVSGGIVSLNGTSATLVEGVIDVSSASGVGGRVEVLGPVVALLDSAVIDASGDTGGGTVLIGGDYQGHNPDITNSLVTWIGGQAEIHADARLSGNGGKVIVWADESTHFQGLITARGGAVSGDGGFVEVSGKEFLSFRGQADLSAEHGGIGTLLLDPTDLIIANGTADSAADGTATFSGNPSGVVGTILGSDTGPTTIYESELQGLTATANIVLQATNNVTINDLTDNTLSLAATTGSLTIRADSDGNGVGNFSMNTGDTIRTQGGAVNIRGASLTAIGIINTTGSAGVAGGAVTLTADAGVISVTGAITTTGGSNSAGGAVLLTASSAVTVSSTITTSGGTYVASNPGRNAGAVSITGSAVSVVGITTTGRTATTSGFSGGNGGAVLLDATAGGITLGGSITTTGGNGSGTGLGGNAGNITVNDAATLTANVVLSAVGGTRATSGAGGNIQLLGAVDGNVAATRTLTLTAGTGDVTVGGAIGATNSLSALTITSNDTSLASIGGASAGVSGATSVTATTAGADVGAITFTGTTYNANAQTYTAGAGNNLLFNSGATTTFTTTADVVTFTTATLLLADGSNLVVNTAGGVISAIAGIRGTSFENVTLNSGATTLTVGAIGTANEIGAVALTATTATLSGDIITGDVAGNNVTITGAVTLNNTVGTTLTIDTDNATNDGTITITGTVTGAARNLALLGGAISTAAITTTGGSNQDGGAVMLTGSGVVTVSGTITTSGGAYLASNPGRNAEAVSITGSTVAVVGITAVGTTATTSGFDGGAGGAVLLDATAGGITLGGNISTTGGNGSGAGLGGNAGNITVSDAATLTANVVLSAVGVWELLLVPGGTSCCWAPSTAMSQRRAL